jgi:DNA-binding CsgD family transcriptional regulator
MSYRDEDSSNRVLFLMDIAASLANHTQNTVGFHGIPGFLARILSLPSVSVAVVRTAPDGAAIVLSAFSGTTVPASFEQELLSIHQQTRLPSLRESPGLRATLELAPADVDGGGLASVPRATVFVQTVDERHCLLLIVHQRDEDPQLSSRLNETLQLVSRQLARLLEPLVIWLDHPELIGEPFDQLTEREWIVLRRLDSEAGEKQLADQLGLSPHTLHSHIKSIYRKIGVQGRLQLLVREEEVRRHLRQSVVEARVAQTAPRADDRSITAA